MRGLLITNPSATTAAGWSRDIVVKSLAAEVDLTVELTRYRGHASELAAAARAEQLDVVFTLGGDGTVNETINGLLSATEGDCPLLGTIPGGLANVFPRALGFPGDAMATAGLLIEALHHRSTRRIPLGRLNGRYFAFNAGMGLDAAVIHAVEQSRAEGRKASASGYVIEAIRQLWDGLGTAEPHITIEAHSRSGTLARIEDAYLAIVQNTTPWSFAGPVPLELGTAASFDSGLEVLGLTNLSPAAVAAFFAEGAARLPAERRLVSAVAEDCDRIQIWANRLLPVQVDGDSIGEFRELEITLEPSAIEVLVPVDR